MSSDGALLPEYFAPLSTTMADTTGVAGVAGAAGVAGSGPLKLHRLSLVGAAPAASARGRAATGPGPLLALLLRLDSPGRDYSTGSGGADNNDGGNDDDGGGGGEGSDGSDKTSGGGGGCGSGCGGSGSGSGSLLGIMSRVGHVDSSSLEGQSDDPREGPPGASAAIVLGGSGGVGFGTEGAAGSSVVSGLLSSAQHAKLQQMREGGGGSGGSGVVPSAEAAARLSYAQHERLRKAQESKDEAALLLRAARHLPLLGYEHAHAIPA